MPIQYEKCNYESDLDQSNKIQNLFLKVATSQLTICRPPLPPLKSGDIYMKDKPTVLIRMKNQILNHG